MSQSLFREWVVSGSMAAAACSGSRSGPMLSLILWGPNKRPAPNPFTPFPSIPLSCYSNKLHKPLSCWGRMWVVEGFGLVSTAGRRKMLWPWFLLQGVVGVSLGTLLSRINKMGRGVWSPLRAVSNLKRQLRKRNVTISRRRALRSLVETSSSQFSLGKSEPVFSTLLSRQFQIFCQRSEKPSSPPRCTSPNLPVCICLWKEHKQLAVFNDSWQ